MMSVDIEFFEKKLFPVLIQLSKDKVSNVRMNCALVLRSIQSNSKEIMREVNLVKDELKKDNDIDILNALE